jgi:hypothetical protein
VEDYAPPSERLAIVTHRVGEVETGLRTAVVRIDNVDAKLHAFALEAAVFRAEIRRTFAVGLSVASAAITIATAALRFLFP